MAREKDAEEKAELERLKREERDAEDRRAMLVSCIEPLMY